MPAVIWLTSRPDTPEQERCKVKTHQPAEDGGLMDFLTKYGSEATGGIHRVVRRTAWHLHQPEPAPLVSECAEVLVLDHRVILTATVP